MSALDTVWAAVTWPFRQVAGFLGNLWTWITTGLSLRDVTLPSIYDSLVWLSNQVPMALGWSSPGSQIEASFVLGVTSFVTGFVTGGLAWALIALWVFTGVVGVARFTPAVNSRWPLSPMDAPSLGVLGGGA
jgi:hypothetical protein